MSKAGEFLRQHILRHPVDKEDLAFNTLDGLMLRAIELRVSTFVINASTTDVALPQIYFWAAKPETSAGILHYQEIYNPWEKFGPKDLSLFPYLYEAYVYVHGSAAREKFYQLMKEREVAIDIYFPLNGVRISSKQEDCFSQMAKFYLPMQVVTSVS